MAQSSGGLPVDSKETLAELAISMRQRGDLPGFSRAVSAILTAMRGDASGEFNLTRTVLSDPALTQKVLRLANGSMYAVFGQEINTVTKAVAVLGKEAIGHLALGLKLIDGLSVVSADSQAVRTEMEKAVLAGHIGRQVAALASMRDAEEAVVCAMLHALGRLLVSYYLPAQWQRLRAFRAEHECQEAVAALMVLGLGLDQVGRQVAHHWGLPASLVNTLPDIAATVLTEPLDHNGWLGAVASMALRSADVSYDQDADTDAALRQIANSYADMLGVAPAALLAAVEAARETAHQEMSSRVAPKALKKVVSDSANNVANNVADDSANDPPDNLAASVAVYSGLGNPHPAPTVRGKRADAAQHLARGAADLAALRPDSAAAPALSIVLEVLYQSLGCEHAAVFQRMPQEHRYLTQMLLGEELGSGAQLMAFSDAYQPDVFHAALANDKMVFIDNALDPRFVNKLPRWWKHAVPGAIGLLIIPLTVERQPIGFVYADWDAASVPATIAPAEISALNTLRGLLNTLLARQSWPASSWGRAN